MKANNKKCILCGKTYTYCSRCEEFDHLPRWMEIYCSDNCRTIFNTLTSYNSKTISANEALNILNTCDLSDVDKFHEFNQGLVKEVLGSKKEIEKEANVEVETITPVEEKETPKRKPVRIKAKSEIK